jgi:hypothetical protein
MTARHGAPAPTPDIELSPYPSSSYPSEPGPSSSAHQPLLRPSGHGLGLDYEAEADNEAVMPIRRTGPRRNTLRRYWKPLLFVSLPFALVFLYSVIHPHVPGLPALPKVKVHFDNSGSGSGSGASLSTSGNGRCEEHGCICGQTDEGKRLCEVYRPEGLVTSQLVKGSGARVRRMLQKARDGERVKVGVLGGSGEPGRNAYRGRGS